MPHGFLEGVQADFGEFSECLSNESPKEPDTLTVRGKYCLMSLILPVPSLNSYNESEPMPDLNIFTSLPKYHGIFTLSSMKAFLSSINHFGDTIYRLGICIPSQCTGQEFQNVFNKSKFYNTNDVKITAITFNLLFNFQYCSQ